MEELLFYIVRLKTKKLAVRTIEEYSRVLYAFHNFFHNKSIEIRDVTFQDIRDYLIFLLETNKEISTNHHIVIIRAFYNWMVDRRGLSVNPCLRVETLKEEDLLPVFLVQRELNLLYKLIDEDNSIKIQDVTMLDVLVGTGIRTVELCNLKTTDYFEDAGTGFFRLRVTKGGDEREVAMPDYTKDAVLKFMQAIALRGYKENWIFPNSFGRQLTRQAVYNRIEKMAKKVKSRKKGAHMLRHTFATLAMNRDVPIKALQMQMGHKSFDTTAQYMHTSHERLKNVFDQFHPKA